MQSGTEAYNQQASKTRRDQLILAHLPMVKHVLGRLVGRLPSGVDAENLESAGILGLVEAANRFDPERGVNFETYAYPRVRGAVVDELRRNSCLSQLMLEQVACVQRAYRRLQAPVTVEALVNETEMSEDLVMDCLAAMRLARTVPLENLGQRAENEPTSGSEPPGYGAEKAELNEILALAIASLPERQRLVVTLYYLEDLRLKEIGEVLGLSESRVSRLLDEGLFDLGEYMRARGL